MKTNTIAPQTKRPSYWLIIRQALIPSEILSIRLSDGKETLPVFSFMEEAEMFLQLQGLQEEWRTRQTAPGELHSLFYTVLRDIEHVTLDPIPEISSQDNSRLLSMHREDFLSHLQRVNGRGRSLEKRDSVQVLFSRHQTA